MVSRPGSSQPDVALTVERSANRFERYPLRSVLGILAGSLALAELALRLADPGPLRFAREMRHAHRYSRTSWVDLVPSRSVHLRLDCRDGSRLLDFHVTASPEAFRIAQAAPPPRASAPTRFVHAVGDSFTMGWGVEAENAWPAQLQARLPEGVGVLNLGVDGFGAVGATAKSIALAGRYPPALAIYLFSPNDLEDDQRAAAGHPAAFHLAMEAFDALRRTSALVNLPFAVRYGLFFRESGATTWAVRGASPPAMRLDRPHLDLTALPAPDPQHPTFVALRHYRDFLAGRGTRLAVLVLSTQEPALRAYRFCREQGIDAVVFDVPPDLRIPGDGHFDERGNRAVADLAFGLVSPWMNWDAPRSPASGRRPER